MDIRHRDNAEMRLNLGWIGVLIDWGTRLLVFALLCALVFVVWAAIGSWQNISRPNGTAAAAERRRTWHVCAQCQTKFRCREAPIVSVNSSTEPLRRRRQPLNGYRRRTVYLGAVPIEVSETNNEPVCCQTGNAQVIPSNKHFCSFACYRSLSGITNTGKTLGSSNNSNSDASSATRAKPSCLYSRLLKPHPNNNERKQIQSVNAPQRKRPGCVTSTKRSGCNLNKSPVA
jgi:hypothetical protein